MISAQIPATFEELQQADRPQGKEENPSLTEMLRRAISLMKNSHQSSWERIKTAIHELQFRYFPPNLEGSESDETNQKDEAGGNVKRAVGKSFETSKEMFKGSAKSAARAVSKTMQITKKERKTSVSEENSNSEEL